MIIGIVGTIGSGKGAVVQYLKQKAFTHYSGSGLLREILSARGEDVNRDAYSRIAQELREKDPLELCKLLYARVLSDQPDHAVLEALHTMEEVEFVRGIGGKIIGIDADIALRYERITKRGSEKDLITYEKFTEQSKREDEGSFDPSTHNIRAALGIADVVLTNNGPLQDLYTQIDKALVQFTR
ncbi:MAG: hypothetical protein JWN18_202 [Parcubacteria group bacterium]|nr:hypothetical protein [Parcubacteria group bacterium]